MTSDLRESVAYSTYGDPANPTLLFLHGIRLGREIWAQHAQALADRYHIVTVDLPGHGTQTQTAFTAEGIGAMMQELTQTVAPQPPLVIGYSLGGYVAMQYASEFPERTRGLLLADCTLDFEGWKQWPYELSIRLSQALPETMLTRLLEMSLRLTLPKKWADIVVPIPFNRDVISHSGAIARAQTYFSEKLAAYQKPVLFVNGEYDLLFRVDEKRFLRRVPHARLRIIRNALHTAPMSHLRHFTAIVREFAEKVFSTVE